METKQYKVDLDSYEGPMDLLLHLVNKDEVDIYDISIESLTTQYLEHLETFKELNIPLASEFLVMASQLLYIKSRALLPRDVAIEDEGEEDDPRWDLIRQLLEYKKFKEAANHLQIAQEEQTSLYKKAFSLIEENSPPQELQEVSTSELFKAFEVVMRRFQDSIEVGEISDDQFNVNDKIIYLQKKLTQHKRMKFSEIILQATTKQEVIVTFLAILELAKLNKLKITQPNHFDDLVLEPV